MAAAVKVEAASGEGHGTDRTIKGSDYTLAFKEVVKSKDDHLHRRQKWEKQRDDALGPILGQERLALLKSKEKSGQGISQRERDCLRLRKADEEWIGEARKVYRSILAVVEFLQSIRRAYLSSDGGSETRSRSTEKGDRGALESWKGVTSLSDKERDEIEFQVKVMIKRCLGRVQELEKGEEVRKRTTASLSANPFSRLLGAASTSSFPGRSHPLYAEQLTLHRSSMTQYLSKRLANVNSKLGDMQEARLRSQQKRRLNLGGSAAAKRGAGGDSSEKQAMVAGSVRVSGKEVSSSKGDKNSDFVLPPEDGEDFVLQTDFTASDLTPQQVQQFEEESSALIKSLSEDLAAVQATERSLAEISDMQTQLIQHLGNQAEVADHLQREGMEQNLELGKGNEQLQRAKENHRQASKFLCIFLVGSGLALLMLHFMD